MEGQQIVDYENFQNENYLKDENENLGNLKSLNATQFRASNLGNIRYAAD